MNKALIIALLFSATQAVSLAAMGDTLAQADPTPKEQEAKMVEKAGVVDKEAKEVEKAVKSEQSAAMKESTKAEADAIAMQKAIEAKIAQEMGPKKADPKKELTAKEKEEELNKKIEETVKARKEEAEKAVQADRKKTAEQREADIKHKRDRLDEFDRVVKQDAADIAAAAAKLKAERAANKAKLGHMDGEEWTANMPSTYLKGLEHIPHH